MIDKNKRTTFLLSFERENQIHFQCYKLCNNYSEVLSIDITQDSVFVVMEDGGDGGGSFSPKSQDNQQGETPLFGVKCECHKHVICQTVASTLLSVFTDLHEQ